jgi:hypothetical protein
MTLNVHSRAAAQSSQITTGRPANESYNVSSQPGAAADLLFANDPFRITAADSGRSYVALLLIR